MIDPKDLEIGQTYLAHKWFRPIRNDKTRKKLLVAGCAFDGEVQYYINGYEHGLAMPISDFLCVIETRLPNESEQTGE